MAALILTPNLPDPDAFYDHLIRLHEGRSEAESHRINAKLVLLLANHVGDPEAIEEAFRVAVGEGEEG
ncbi:MAG: DUF2783 domain-containing protein [Kiloniellales bacterium]|nr:DUF2783 domain-containing protein [Kiloniellales bacterium]